MVEQLGNKDYFHVWQLPSPVSINIHHCEVRKNNDQMRNIFEKLSFEIYLADEEMPENLKAGFNLLYQLAEKKFKTKQMPKKLHDKKNSEGVIKPCWKLYSTFFEISQVREVVIKFNISPMYCSPMFLLKEMKGNAFDVLRKLFGFRLQGEDTPSQETDPDVIICIVCFSNRRKVIFNTCQHCCCCIQCTNLLLKCPICRGDISCRQVINFS